MLNPETQDLKMLGNLCGASNCLYFNPFPALPAVVKSAACVIVIVEL